MRRSVQLAASAAFAAMMVTGGAHSAFASDTFSNELDVETYSVPADEMATSTTWSAERMEAAIPADDMAQEMAADFDFDMSDVAVGQPLTIQGQSAESSANSFIDLNRREVPIAYMGKVFFTKADGRDYVCSANSVASANGNTVATAGHCLSDGNGNFATEFIFVPGYENGQDPYGQWRATDLVTTTSWHESGDFNYDAAFAVVDGPGSATLADTVGATGIAFNQQRGLPYTLFGYPARAPFNGQELHSCTGIAQPDTFGGSMSQGVACDMTQGSSGGPWLIGAGTSGVQNSVNSFKYDAIQDRMFGPYFGDVIEQTYQDAQYL